MLFMHKIVYIFSSNYILLFRGFEIHHFMVSFLKIFQIFVQCATWFEFAMSVLTPFLFGKILISNKLYISTLLKHNICANLWYPKSVKDVDS